VRMFFRSQVAREAPCLRSRWESTQRGRRQ
jgi:hypothetical protein